MPAPPAPPVRPLRARLLLAVLAVGLVLALVLSACGAPQGPAAAVAEAPAPEAYVPEAYAPDASHLPASIAAAYERHRAKLPAGKSVAYDLDLSFGGNPRFAGRVTQSVPMDRVRLQRAADGMELRYDGADVVLVGDTAAGEPWPRARFDAFTWPYFFAAPFKLADPGTQWAEPTDTPWAADSTASGARLTFASGTGDAPDDYYVVVPGADGLLDGMAYVVTFGKGPGAAADAAPHAIRYSDYRDVDGVPVAHRWEFFNWNAADGLGEEVIGEADLSNVAWVEPSEGAFATTGGVPVTMP